MQHSILPIIESLKEYKNATFFHDLWAGTLVAIVLIPQGMAYAYLAGMPAVYGLYGGLVPLFLYALFGTSRQMAIGPVAISALLVLAGVSQLAAPFTETYIQLVLLLGLLVGIAQLILGLVRLGAIVNFISHPVIVGFTSAAAIIIVISQLKDLLGFEISQSLGTRETILYAINHWRETHWLTLSVGVGSIFLIAGLKMLSKKIPGALAAVVLSIFLSWLLNLEEQGLDIVGNVPQGLPKFVVPIMDWNSIRQLLPIVFTVTIIGIVESIGIAKVMEAKCRDHVVRPNQELFALGIAKIGGAFFQAIPSSGSFTRTAINHEAGAKTSVASLMAVVSVIITLLFLTPLFYYLPKTVLVAIILLAVKSLFDYKEAIFLWKTHRWDFAMMAITFIVTLGFGIEAGVFAGVACSILAVLYRSSKPEIIILGKMPGTTYYRNINRFKQAEQISGKLIMRFENQLYFANASYFKESVRKLVEYRKDELEDLLLDAKSMHDVDSTGILALHEVNQYLKDRNIKFLICGAVGVVRDQLEKSGFFEEIGPDRHFIYLDEALGPNT